MRKPTIVDRLPGFVNRLPSLKVPFIIVSVILLGLLVFLIVGIIFGSTEASSDNYDDVRMWVVKSSDEELKKLVTASIEDDFLSKLEFFEIQEKVNDLENEAKRIDADERRDQHLKEIRRNLKKEGEKDDWRWQ